ncbi:MAG TPA: proline dehydrogenase family protein, partial [Longimicrobium sp.]|nr:proline dehydrogenase family protein [Longimicrobium sp.]
CHGNMARILDKARHHQGFVRLDMESSEYTQKTLSFFTDRLYVDYRHHAGVVIQSALRRSEGDINDLIRLDARVRLCKGAYLEPPSVAYPDKADVDRAYVQEMERLLEAGVYPAIATHDEAMIDHARRFVWERGIGKESFEFQMLYGVRRDLQTRLREEGYHVRVYVPFGDSWYPYLMRRLAERPANMLFMAGSIMKEARGGGIGKPAAAVGAGILAGVLATLAFRRRR